LKYDSYYSTLNSCKEKYEKQYGVSFNITQADYDAKTPEQQAIYQEAMAAMNADEDAVVAYNMLVNLSLVIVSISVLAAYLVLEFAVPLLFGNGQTVGKKVFAIGVMKTSGVKLDAVSLFIRTVLGKYTLETMIPLLIAIMMIWGLIGILGPAIIFVLLAVQIVMMISSKTNSPIHDALAQTVAIDLHSQMIFGDEAQMMEYKRRAHEEMVRRSPY
jgi:uncharacterized RDD family membrane protein YckC